MRFEVLSADRSERRVVEYFRVYQRRDSVELGRGFSGFEFPCSPDGAVDGGLNEAAVANLVRCVSGEVDVVDQGVRREASVFHLCRCGSGESPYSLKDGHGIYLTKACERCEMDKLAEFRPDIMDRYSCDEAVETADYY